MGMATRIAPGAAVDPDILALLGHRYADGLVYFGASDEREAFERAVHLGLVSRDGYLTPEGRAVLARCGAE